MIICLVASVSGCIAALCIDLIIDFSRSSCIVLVKRNSTIFYLVSKWIIVLTRACLSNCVFFSCLLIQKLITADSWVSNDLESNFLTRLRESLGSGAPIIFSICLVVFIQLFVWFLSFFTVRFADYAGGDYNFLHPAEFMARFIWFITFLSLSAYTNGGAEESWIAFGISLSLTVCRTCVIAFMHSFPVDKVIKLIPGEHWGKEFNYRTQTDPIGPMQSHLAEKNSFYFPKDNQHNRSISPKYPQASVNVNLNPPSTLSDKKEIPSGISTTVARTAATLIQLETHNGTIVHTKTKSIANVLPPAKSTQLDASLTDNFSDNLQKSNDITNRTRESPAASPLNQGQYRSTPTIFQNGNFIQNTENTTAMVVSPHQELQPDNFISEVSCRDNPSPLFNPTAALLSSKPFLAQRPLAPAWILESRLMSVSWTETALFFDMLVSTSILLCMIIHMLIANLLKGNSHPSPPLHANLQPMVTTLLPRKILDAPIENHGLESLLALVRATVVIIAGQGIPIFCFLMRRVDLIYLPALVQYAKILSARIASAADFSNNPSQRNTSSLRLQSNSNEGSNIVSNNTLMSSRRSIIPSNSLQPHTGEVALFQGINDYGDLNVSAPGDLNTIGVPVTQNKIPSSSTVDDSVSQGPRLITLPQGAIPPRIQPQISTEEFSPYPISIPHGVASLFPEDDDDIGSEGSFRSRNFLSDSPERRMLQLLELGSPRSSGRQGRPLASSTEKYEDAAGHMGASGGGGLTCRHSALMVQQRSQGAQSTLSIMTGKVCRQKEKHGDPPSPSLWLSPLRNSIIIHHTDKQPSNFNVNTNTVNTISPTITKSVIAATSSPMAFPLVSNLEGEEEDSALFSEENGESNRHALKVSLSSFARNPKFFINDNNINNIDTSDQIVSSNSFTNRKHAILESNSFHGTKPPSSYGLARLYDSSSHAVGVNYPQVEERDNSVSVITNKMTLLTAEKNSQQPSLEESKNELGFFYNDETASVFSTLSNNTVVKGDKEHSPSVSSLAKNDPSSFTSNNQYTPPSLHVNRSIEVRESTQIDKTRLFLKQLKLQNTAELQRKEAQYRRKHILNACSFKNKYQSFHIYEQQKQTVAEAMPDLSTRSSRVSSFETKSSKSSIIKINNPQPLNFQSHSDYYSGVANVNKHSIDFSCKSRSPSFLIMADENNLRKNEGIHICNVNTNNSNDDVSACSGSFHHYSASLPKPLQNDRQDIYYAESEEAHARDVNLNNVHNNTKDANVNSKRNNNFNEEINDCSFEEAMEEFYSYTKTNRHFAPSVTIPRHFNSQPGHMTNNNSYNTFVRHFKMAAKDECSQNQLRSNFQIPGVSKNDLSIDIMANKKNDTNIKNRNDDSDSLFRYIPRPSNTGIASGLFNILLGSNSRSNTPIHNESRDTLIFNEDVHLRVSASNSDSSATSITINSSRTAATLNNNNNTQTLQQPKISSTNLTPYQMILNVPSKERPAHFIKSNPLSSLPSKVKPKISLVPYPLAPPSSASASLHPSPTRLECPSPSPALGTASLGFSVCSPVTFHKNLFANPCTSTPTFFASPPRHLVTESNHSSPMPPRLHDDNPPINSPSFPLGETFQKDISLAEDLVLSKNDHLTAARHLRELGIEDDNLLATDLIAEVEEKNDEIQEDVSDGGTCANFVWPSPSRNAVTCKNSSHSSGMSLSSYPTHKKKVKMVSAAPLNLNQSINLDLDQFKGAVLTSRSCDTFKRAGKKGTPAINGLHSLGFTPTSNEALEVFPTEFDGTTRHGEWRLLAANSGVYHTMRHSQEASPISHIMSSQPISNGTPLNIQSLIEVAPPVGSDGHISWDSILLRCVTPHLFEKDASNEEIMVREQVRLDFLSREWREVYDPTCHDVGWATSIALLGRIAPTADNRLKAVKRHAAVATANWAWLKAGSGHLLTHSRWVIPSILLTHVFFAVSIVLGDPFLFFVPERPIDI